jgi:hypothetical protein
LIYKKIFKKEILRIKKAKKRKKIFKKEIMRIKNGKRHKKIKKLICLAPHEFIFNSQCKKKVDFFPLK